MQPEENLQQEGKIPVAGIKVLQQKARRIFLQKERNSCNTNLFLLWERYSCQRMKIPAGNFCSLMDVPRYVRSYPKYEGNSYSFHEILQHEGYSKLR